MGSWRSSSMFCMMGATLWVLSLIHGSFAQTSSCTTATLTPLLPCLPYIEAGNSTRPGSDCCNPLRTILNSSDPTCICQIAPLANQTGITVNQTRALEVAASCNQTVPDSVTSCLSGAPSSPSTTPSGTPTSPGTPSQGGTGNSSDGSALLPPSLVLIGSIFVALLVHLSMST